MRRRSEDEPGGEPVDEVGNVGGHVPAQPGVSGCQPHGGITMLVVLTTAREDAIDAC